MPFHCSPSYSLHNLTSMAITRYSKSINLIFFFFLFFFFFFTSTVKGQQISTACTSSLISSFTPCFNFLTGSSNGGPSGDCCSSLASLISNSLQCACLILTGNVPISLPFNRNISISLTQLCGSRSVPLQCSSAVGAPLPGPGPVSYSPSLPPLPPQPPLPAVSVESPPPSVTSSSQSPPMMASPPSVTDTPGNQRPLILPNSVAKISTIHSLSILMIFMAALKYLL